MKRIALVLLFVFGLVLQARTQEKKSLQGYCKSENGDPIENVSVYAHDSLLVSVTDDKGRFTCWSIGAGETFRFAHMGYEPTYYTVKEKDFKDKELKIKLKTRSHELLEVSVTANAPHIAFDNPVMSVIDYVIRDDGIFLIAYRRRNTTLLHLSFDLDTLHELPISSRYKHLNKDAFGDIYALNDYQASLVGFMELPDGKKILMNFYHSYPRKTFYEKLSTIVTACDSVFITGRYFYYNKEMGYYLHHLGRDEDPTPLHYIVDEEGRDDCWIQLKTTNRVDYFSSRPIYNPIYGIDNKFYLLAFTDCETIIFDTSGVELERHPLTFHEYRNWDGKMLPDRRWKQKVLFDTGAKQFYTFFVEDGIYTLKHIDLETGTATTVYKLDRYPFAEKLRIHNGVLYFIYPTGISHRKALYQVQME